MRFTGKFNKLCALGYTFQKLYANNYRCYHKKLDGHHIWVWQKGKEIEVDDWYHITEAIIKALTAFEWGHPYAVVCFNHEDSNIKPVVFRSKDVMTLYFGRECDKAKEWQSMGIQISYPEGTNRYITVHQESFSELIEELAKIQLP